MASTWKFPRWETAVVSPKSKKSAAAGSSYRAHELTARKLTANGAFSACARREGTQTLALISPSLAEREGGEAGRFKTRKSATVFIFLVFVNSNKDGQSVVSFDDREPQQHGIGLTFFVCVLISVV